MPLQDELRTIVEYHRIHGARGLDAEICRAIADAPEFTYQQFHEVGRALTRAVEEALAGRECRDKRALQRGWMIGVIAGAVRRGYDREEVAYLMAYNGLLSAVEAGTILAVYSFSLAWAFGHSCARLGWPPDLEPGLQEAMERGLAAAEAHLGGEVQAQERKWMRRSLATGWRTGVVLARFLPGGPLPVGDRHPPPGSAAGSPPPGAAPRGR